MSNQGSSNWGVPTRAAALAGFMMLAATGATACGSSESASSDPASVDGDDAPVSVEWAASGLSSENLVITEWVLRGTTRHSELFGLLATGEPGAYRALAHVTFDLGEDYLRVEADLPERWLLEVRPGESPEISGPMSGATAYVLSSGILDRLGMPGEDPSIKPKFLPAAGGLRPLGGTSLIECPQQLLHLVEGADGKTRVATAAERAFALAHEYYDTIKKLGGPCNIDDAANYDMDSCMRYAIREYGKNNQFCPPGPFAEVLMAGDAYDKLTRLQAEALRIGVGGYGQCLSDGNEEKCAREPDCKAKGGVFTRYGIEISKDPSLLNCGDYFSK